MLHTIYITVNGVKYNMSTQEGVWGFYQYKIPQLEASLLGAKPGNIKLLEQNFDPLRHFCVQYNPMKSESMYYQPDVLLNAITEVESLEDKCRVLSKLALAEIYHYNYFARKEEKGIARFLYARCKHLGGSRESLDGLVERLDTFYVTIEKGTYRHHGTTFGYNKQQERRANISKVILSIRR